MKAKVGIIGGGIIGLAIAHKLQKKYSGIKIILFEKEPEIGLHQSGRNSGVLHCGLYYEPGSLKAMLAVSGIRQMTDFCRENQVNHEICGKIVVASNAREEVFLDNLAKRGKANGLNGLNFLTKDELKVREPYVHAKKVLLVPQEGIVDYKEVMKKLATMIQEREGEIFLNTKITNAIETASDFRISDGSMLSGRLDFFS